jgi:hypothetical protein
MTTIQRTAETCPGRPCGKDCDHVETLPDPTVETEVWVPDPLRPGYLVRERIKTVNEVASELLAVLGYDTQGSTPGCDDYFGVCAHLLGERPWPGGRIVVYPVTGSNEGHYIHVAVATRQGEHQLLMLGKTFDGWDACWAFAKRVATILGV